VLLKLGREGVGERDQTLAFLRLRLDHAQRAIDQVDVPPPERHNLAAAHPGQDEREEHPSGSGVGERVTESRHLVGLENPPARPRRADSAGGPLAAGIFAAIRIHAHGGGITDVPAVASAPDRVKLPGTMRKC
jgi:hypothetical protein